MRRSSSRHIDTGNPAQGPSAVDLVAMAALVLLPWGMKATGLRKRALPSPSADSAARQSQHLHAAQLQTQMRNWHMQYDEALQRQKDLEAIVRDPDRGLKNAFAQQALSDANKGDHVNDTPHDEDRALLHWTQRVKELHGVGTRLKTEYDHIILQPAGQP
jgi:hypothetical protein